MEGVRATLDAQVAAWNAGDLKGYLEHVHPDVQYVTSRGPLRGLASLADHYRQDGAPYGSLSVEPVDVHLAGDVATVVLRFQLDGDGLRAGWALVTFVWEGGRWLLFRDATLRGA
ncbi:MAG: nuclear transport factor 2 family protein [Alphaproteobacteria bacterium]|nr:nuclear transport factor 2 family protein [Alphaproteobacteria bacterium]MCB9694788.1 nuclear transport factor 2 family protein [Alphaproteobacteria bacterium]